MTSQPLEEQVKARIAELRRSQEMFQNEYKEGNITIERYHDFYGRIGLRIDECEQVLSLIEEKAKELEAERLEQDWEDDDWTEGHNDAIDDALALLIKKE